MAEPSTSEKFVVELLALPSLAEQMARLVAVHLANEDGLNDLLTHAEQAVRHDPSQARGLAQVCEDVATLISIPSLVPRATYLRAQTHVLRRDAQIAMTLIDTAHDQFLVLNRTADALRTDVGAMTALTTLGRYQDALQRGNAALTQARSEEATADAESLIDLARIRAKIHVNQGPALSEMGRFDEALTAYAEAEKIYASLQMTDDQVLVLSNRGVALRYLGRVDEALGAYQQAAALLPRSGYLYALMQNNIGDAHLLLGDYQASLVALAEARREFAAQDAVFDSQICASHMADAYLALNLYPEALALYQTSAESLENTDYHYYLGKALWGIGSAHGALSELEKSSTALARAVALFARLDNTPIAAQIMLEQSALGESAVAFLLAQQALDSLGDGQVYAAWPVQEVYAHLRLADLLREDVEAAERHLRHVETLLQGLSLPHLRYRFLQRLGQVRRLQDRDDEAQQAFEAAITEIERLRSSLVDEAMLVSFQQDKMAAYEGLIRIFLDRLATDQYDEDAIRQTFDLIERAKSRALVDRISGAVQAEIAEGADPETTERLQRIQMSLNAIYSDMLGHDSGTPNDQETRGDRSVRMAQLSRRAGELEQELTQTRLQLATHARRAESFEPFDSTASDSDRDSSRPQDRQLPRHRR
jgi:tetratricopeptide (TPR) repeat protein